MKSFREVQVGKPRLLKTKSTLPVLINQDSNSDKDEKNIDIKKQTIHLK